VWVANGSFDSDNTPHVDCILSAFSSEKGRVSTCVSAVIDTGFVGFLSIPLEYALALELPLMSIDDFRMADGRTTSLYSARAYVQIGERCRRVRAILQPQSSEVLVGVALLRALNLALLLTRDKVLLLDQDSIEDIYDPHPGHLVIRDSATASAA
jgi:clan AA aspartic protease